MNYTLTITQVKNAKPLENGNPRKLRDGAGLYLFVTSTLKSWRYKYRIGKNENTFTIGQFPEVSIAEAREQHKNAVKLVHEGMHPLAQKKAVKLQKQFETTHTFASVALSWIDGKKSNWTAYYYSQVKRAFEKDVNPTIGMLPVRAVTSPHILALIKSVEKRGASVVAIQIKQWISAVFRHAAANLLVDHDPTVVLKGLVVRPKVKHNVALQPSQVTALIKAMAKYGGYRTTAIAIELLMLTFVRTVELRKAMWSEFELEKGEWRLPAERMKMKIAHYVPLSSQAIKLLEELKTITGSNPHLFPNLRRPDAVMTPTTINQALKRIGFCGAGTVGFSAHGFRGTASTILYEKGYRSEVIEKQLAHAEKSQTKAAYNQAEYLADRKKMMQEWGDFIDTIRL